MKKNLILFVILLSLLLIFFLPFTNPSIQNQLNDSSTSKNFSGTGSWSNLTYIQLPKSATINSTTLNLTGYGVSGNASICYQESANVSTACGGLNTGIYGSSGTWTNLSKTYDGDWDTYGKTTSADVFVYANYSKPTNSLNSSLWQVKDQDAIINLTIPNNCWSQSYLQFRGWIDAFVGPFTRVYWHCYNGTAWQQLRVSSNQEGYIAYVYEEAMIWNITSVTYPSNVTLQVNNSYIFNQTGIFSTQNQTIDFKGNVTEFLSGCTAVNGYCDLPLNISATDGLVQISAININYTTPVPSINITYPINNSNTTNTQLNVNYTITNASINSCWWTNNSGLSNHSITCGNNITGQTWNEGLNTIKVFINNTENQVNSSSINFRLDTTAPNLSISFPVDFTSYNYHNQTLNFLASDSGVGLSSCWKRLNSGANITIDCAINSTVNETDESTIDGSNTIYLWANDTLNNVVSTSITFGISTVGPAITLNYPTDNKYLNNRTTYFNFTSVDLDGLSQCQLYGNWSGTWAKNFTWVNPTNNTMNFTIINLIEGRYKWNIWCNDTLGNPSWALTNFTVNIDLTNPNVTINRITTILDSKAITFNSTNSDNFGLNTCKYSIYNSLGVIDALNENVSFTCSNQEVSAVVSAYDTYTLRVYAKDLAGNEIYNTKTFTVSTTPVTPPGGGGGGESPKESSTIALINLNETSQFPINRCVLYARIREFCQDKIDCFLTQDKKSELLTNLSGDGIILNTEDLELWIKQYNENKLEVIKMLDSDIKKYGLFTGIIQISTPGFEISPKTLDPFFTFILFGTENRYLVKSNRVLKNASVLSGSDEQIGIILTSDTTASVILNVANISFSSRTFLGTINYVSSDGSSAFQTVSLRVVNLKSPITLITGGIIIFVVVISIYKRKKFKSFGKSILNKLKAK